MGHLTLVLGGIRSGKSAFAERLAAGAGPRLLYVATSAAGDAEMQDRISRHRQRRSSEWTTVEAPLDPAGALRSAGPGWDAVLLDSVSGWLANVLLGPPESSDGIITDGIDELLAWYRETGIRTVLVSDEVGMTLVSPNPVGRRYQDLLGTANQRLASSATNVFLVAAGLPVCLKGPAS